MTRVYIDIPQNGTCRMKLSGHHTDVNACNGISAIFFALANWVKAYCKDAVEDAEGLYIFRHGYIKYKSGGAAIKVEQADDAVRIAFSMAYIGLIAINEEYKDMEISAISGGMNPEI